MSTYTWNSIEALFEKLGLHYLVVSLLLADIFYIVYFSFSYFVAIFELNDPYYVLQISAMSVLVGYEMAGIKYLLIETRKAFSKIKSDEDNYLISIKNAYSVLEKRLTKSHWYYAAIIVLIVAPPLIIDSQELASGQVSTFYWWDETIPSALLDAYNYLVTYLIIMLLAIILWIMVNVLFLIYQMGNGQHLIGLKFNPFSADQIGGLGSIKNLILKFITFYFVCVTLIVLSYVGPSSLISHPSIFYLVLLIIGVMFFAVCSLSLQRILKRKISEELDVIGSLYEKKSKEIIKTYTEEKEHNKEDIAKLSTDIEALVKCRERLLKIGWKVFDIKAIAIFIGSFLLTDIAILQRFPEINSAIARFIASYPIYRLSPIT
jgi:hypothetical protein